MNTQLPNNVTIETVKRGHYAIKYWGNLIGYVNERKGHYWRAYGMGREHFAATRHEAVTGLWNQLHHK